MMAYSRKLVLENAVASTAPLQPTQYPDEAHFQQITAVKIFNKNLYLDGWEGGNTSIVTLPRQLESHEGLKILILQKVKLSQGGKISLAFLLEFLPNLEKLAVYYQKARDAARLLPVDIYQNSIRKLKCLDLIEMYSNGMGSQSLGINWGHLALQKLTYDCGYDNGRKEFRQLIYFQSRTLEELHLFQAPWAQPYTDFPFNRPMGNLTELYLWGNVCENLNFVRWMPNLRILKWNINCYDEKTYGGRLHKRLGHRPPRAQFARDILEENTNEIDDYFWMSHMETLEFYPGELSLWGFKQLGKWMPNLKTLKATVVGDGQLVAIGKQWPDLQHLELAHGSEITAMGILEFHSTRKPSQMLKSFKWKPCPCIRMDFVEAERHAEDLLRASAGSDVVLPWKHNRPGSFNVPRCTQVLFEKAVVEGDGRNVRNFLYAVPLQ